jgi:hypothetical protein
VPAGKANDLYLETDIDQVTLVYIEFSQEDKSKDISFEVKKYEINSNSFKSIYKEEKIEDNFKLFILSYGYSLYQIIFNNDYSWFTSKDINYRFTMLKLLDKEKKESKEEKKIEKIEKIEKNDEENEKIDIFDCRFNGKNYKFNFTKINQKINSLEGEEKKEDIINIPVILYLNTLRIIINEKDKLTFKEIKEEDEKILPKHLFDYSISNYIKKTLKIKQNESKDKTFIISIFSQNRELSSIFPEIQNKISALNSSSINNYDKDNDYIYYLEKIGFSPNEDLDGYKVEYKLYDLCEQSLIYHTYLIHKEENKKSILLMQFDNHVVNAAVLNDGAICTKLEKKEKDANWKASYFTNIKIDDTNSVLNLIDNANDTFEGIDLVLSYFDYSDDKKDNLMKLFDTIKKHCEGEINPPIKCSFYAQNEMAEKVFKYINIFYDN